MPTPIYALPFPTSSDSPNGPQQIQDLAQAVEDTLQGDLDLGGSLDVATDLQVGDDATVTGDLQAGGTVKFTSTVMRPQEDRTSADETVTDTSPTAGLVDLVFVAPPSGMVWVSVTGELQVNINAVRGHLSYNLKTGATIGSGTSIISASHERAIVAGEAVNSGAESMAGGTHRTLHTGLTPGNSYNVQAMRWVTSGSMTLLNQAIAVEPIP